MCVCIDHELLFNFKACFVDEINGSFSEVHMRGALADDHNWRKGERRGFRSDEDNNIWSAGTGRTGVSSQDESPCGAE